MIKTAVVVPPQILPIDMLAGDGIAVCGVSAENETPRVAVLGLSTASMFPNEEDQYSIVGKPARYEPPCPYGKTYNQQVRLDSKHADRKRLRRPQTYTPSPRSIVLLRVLFSEWDRRRKSTRAWITALDRV